MVRLRSASLPLWWLLGALLVLSSTARASGNHQQHLAQPERDSHFDSGPPKQHHAAELDAPAHVHADYPIGGFTLIIATYKRTAILEKLLHHLLHPHPPPSLAQVVVVWQNVGEPLPAYLQPAALEQLARETGMGVYVRKSRRNSMNERFRPLLDWDAPIETRAVMVLDDDVVLRRADLEWGWREWQRANPARPRRTARGGRLVGFTGRDFSHHTHSHTRVEEDEEGEREWEYVLQPREHYSLVLTNAAWMKTEWLEHYWAKTDEMKQLRHYVDEVSNCDDLLLNFLAANLSHTAPLLLQPLTSLRTIPTAGVWNAADGSSDLPDEDDDEEAQHARVDHFATRPRCLKFLFDHFAQFAPHQGRHGHWPLKRTGSAVTQDLRDRGRLMAEGERWEEEEEDVHALEQQHAANAEYKYAQAEGATEEKKDGQEDVGDEDDDDDDDDDDHVDEDDEAISARYHKEWEDLLSDMSEREIEELMQTLAKHEAEHHDEEDHHENELDHPAAAAAEGEHEGREEAHVDEGGQDQHDEL